MDVTVEVNRSGPLFDGRADHEVVEFLDDAKQQVAQQGLSNWHENLDSSIRHPTPYYETQITVQSLHDAQVVHDRGIVYGPWLEGTGSRNRTTRFKGYWSLKRAVELLRTQTGPLLERVLRRYLERMR